MRKADNQKSKDITMGRILKWTAAGAGVLFICYVLAILWTLNAHRFKDPETFFIAENYRFDDYYFKDDWVAGQAKGSFKKGMSMDEVDAILVDKNGAVKSDNEWLMGSSRVPDSAVQCYLYYYEPWWEFPVALALLQLDGFQRWFQVCYDKNQKVVYLI